MVCRNVNEHLKKEVNEFANNEVTRVIVPPFFCERVTGVKDTIKFEKKCVSAMYMYLEVFLWSRPRNMTWSVAQP